MLLFYSAPARELQFSPPAQPPLVTGCFFLLISSHGALQLALPPVVLTLKEGLEILERKGMYLGLAASP